MLWTRVTFIHHHNIAILILIQNHSGNLKITCQRKSKAHLNEIRQIELIPKNVWAKTCRILWNSPTCLALKSQCLVPPPWSDDSPVSAEHVCACQSLGKRSNIEPMGKLPRSGIFVNVAGAKERGYQCVEDFKFIAMPGSKELRLSFGQTCFGIPHSPALERVRCLSLLFEAPQSSLPV